MDPEDIPTGFPYADPVDEGLAKTDERLNAENENEKLQAALSCGPQCVSSVLATRYAKILRQERLLSMAASALFAFEEAIAGTVVTPEAKRSAVAYNERSRAIRRQIDEERKNPA